MLDKNFNNKIYLVCYANGKPYENTQKKFIESYKNVGIDEIVIWNKDRLIKTDFYNFLF